MIDLFSILIVACVFFKLISLKVLYREIGLCQLGFGVDPSRHIFLRRFIVRREGYRILLINLLC